MICPQCQEETEQFTKYCPNCGFRLLVEKVWANDETGEIRVQPEIPGDKWYEEELSKQMNWLESQNVYIGTEYQAKRGLFEPYPYDLFDVNENKKFIEYYEYIKKSPEWRMRRNAAKYAAGFRCQLCHRKEREKRPPDYMLPMDATEWQDWKNEQDKKVVLDVHHRTYIRLGDEWLEDLLVLCKDCHRLFSENYDYDKKNHCFTPKPLDKELNIFRRKKND